MRAMNKQAVHHITDTLGADVICESLSVTHHSIRYARTDGRFPASWYAHLKAMCEDVGIPCPLSAFNWKQPTGGREEGPATAAE